MTLPTPSIEYFLLCPTLIVFGVAVVGVLAEAFLPRRVRYGAQVTLALGGLVAAFVAVIAVSRSRSGLRPRAVLGAMAIDRPTLYLQGTVLLVAVLAVIFMAERTQAKADSKVAAGVGAAGCGGLGFLYPAGVRGSRQRRRARGGAGRGRADGALPAGDAVRRRHDGVSRIQRPVDDVRCAGSSFAAPVPDVRAGPASPPAVAGSGDEVLPAGCVLVGVLPLRRGVALRRDRHAAADRHPGCAGGARRYLDGAGGRRPAVGRPAVQGGCGAVPLVDSRRLPGRAHPDHRVHGGGHQGRGVRRAAAGGLRRAAATARSVAAGAVGDCDSDHGGGHHHRGEPDRRQAHAGLFVGRPRRFHPHRCDRRQPGGSFGHVVLPGRLQLQHGRCVRHRRPDPQLPTASRTPPCRTGPGSGSAHPLWA